MPARASLACVAVPAVDVRRLADRQSLGRPGYRPSEREGGPAERDEVHHRARSVRLLGRYGEAVLRAVWDAFRSVRSCWWTDIRPFLFAQHLGDVIGPFRKIL